MLLKMNGYAKYLDEIKYMSILTEDGKILKAYNGCNKISNAKRI